eukprot:TRINITY_DN2981_c0_g6_i1.p1 TRINITY_DN2981_c0_g6~~TRINITY_DN2981_c0_g6_i1.p1  ORF type:complete len:314 (-),score=88.73 TRINITY_DN2981_c0_g6_i1:110-1051(-)
MGKVKKCSVSVLLRFKNADQLPFHLLPSKNETHPLQKNDPLLREIFERREIGGLEILYIRRAINPRDRWSGHVGFPGGGAKEGETELETCFRETEEEIGLVISSPDEWRCLGQMEKISFPTRTSSMVLSIFVFLYLKPHFKEFDYQMQESEVSAISWLPLTFFSPTPNTNKTQTATCQLKPLHYQKLPFYYKLFSVSFPSVELPNHYTVAIHSSSNTNTNNTNNNANRQSDSDSNTNNNTESTTTTTITPTTGSNSPKINKTHKKKNSNENFLPEGDDKDTFVLWGMTLSITSKLIVMCGGQSVVTVPFMSKL